MIGKFFHINKQPQIVITMAIIFSTQNRNKIQDEDRNQNNDLTSDLGASSSTTIGRDLNFFFRGKVSIKH